MEQHIASAATFRAVTDAAEAIQHAANHRIDADQKHRTRELGHVTEAHLATEPDAVAHGLEVYLDDPQAHDVAEAALFFTGTGHYDIMQVRRQLPADTQLAMDALRAQVYTPMGARK